MSKKTETILTGRRIMRALLSLCALLLVAEAIIHRHAYFALEATPFFFALFGILATGLVVAISFALGKLMARAPDYYGGDDD
ncbi:MAG: hypothetical protein ISQ24_00200 [PS1 clade bacterium]|nr:hypothetical protein [PS1 clade bacterium]MBL6783453.1 hypothetical protein [PS1 clade bacterium]